MEIPRQGKIFRLEFLRSKERVILGFKLHCFIDLYTFFNILNISPVRKRVLIVYYFYSRRILAGILGGEGWGGGGEEKSEKMGVGEMPNNK